MIYTPTIQNKTLNIVVHILFNFNPNLDFLSLPLPIQISTSFNLKVVLSLFIFYINNYRKGIVQFFFLKFYIEGAGEHYAK